MRAMTEKYCKVCEENGLKRRLKFCRVNFEEGIFLCEDDMCVYPFGVKAVASLLFQASDEQVVVEKEDRKWQTKSAEKSCQKKETHPTLQTSTSNFYWTNSDNLCWLDSVMSVLVNNRCLQLCLGKYKPKDSVLQHLYDKFIEAQKFGPDKKGRDILCNARMKIFEFLKMKMKCSLGVNDSPLASLNVLLRDSVVIGEKFVIDCEWSFKCALCGYTQVNRQKKYVVTFPNTTEDFSMPSGVFLRACYKCKAVGQRCQLEIKRLPPCVIAHFVEGVTNKDFMKSRFFCQGNEYELCQMIQYIRNPDHFVAWVRNQNGTHWAQVDDTQDPVCKWNSRLPSFPLDQVHLAVWERAKLYQRKASSSGTLAPVESQVSKQNLPEESRKCGLKDADSTRSKNTLLKEPPSLSRTPLPFGRSENVNWNDCRSNATQDNLSKVLNDGKNSLGVQDQKRKNTFEPYIPRKKRLPSLSSPGSLAPSFSSVHANAVSFSEKKVVSGVEKSGVVGDNQSDSGYSSPGSNNSCTSLPSSCPTEEHLILNEIIDSLEEIEFPTTCDNNLGKVDARAKLPCAQMQTDVVLGLVKSEPSKNAKDSVLMSEEYPSNMVDESDWMKDSFCDFADIETLSNCGSTFLDELDSVDFLQGADLSNSNNAEQEHVPVSQRNLEEFEDLKTTLKSLLCKPDDQTIDRDLSPCRELLSGRNSSSTEHHLGIVSPELKEFTKCKTNPMARANSWNKDDHLNDILEEIFPNESFDSARFRT